MISPSKKIVSNENNDRPVEQTESKVNKVVIDEIGPNERYFEAPDGHIMKGSADADRVFYKKEGIWINPKRS